VVLEKGRGKRIMKGGAGRISVDCSHDSTVVHSTFAIPQSKKGRARRAGMDTAQHFRGGTFRLPHFARRGWHGQAVAGDAGYGAWGGTLG
jgi:hypothetical protein